MAYTPYANINDYLELSDLKSIPQEDVLNKLRQASRHIDSLTYNRIRKYGFDNLTEFQKEIICEVVCRQADFEYENQDLISSVLSSYSINGVSMSIGSTWNIHIESGVAVQRDLYSLLEQTGLCCRLVGV